MIKNTGARIKAIRELHGLTQEYVAAKINVSTQTYSNFENETLSLSIQQLNKISEVLNFCPIKLLSNDFHYALMDNKERFDFQDSRKEAYKELLEEKSQIILEKDSIILLLEEELRGLRKGGGK